MPKQPAAAALRHSEVNEESLFCAVETPRLHQERRPQQLAPRCSVARLTAVFTKGIIYAVIEMRDRAVAARRVVYPEVSIWSCTR